MILLVEVIIDLENRFHPTRLHRLVDMHDELGKPMGKVIDKLIGHISKARLDQIGKLPVMMLLVADRS